MDINGKLIEEIPIPEIEEKQITISWNADQIKPGIYLYKIRSETSTNSGKMIKIK